MGVPWNSMTANEENTYSDTFGRIAPKDIGELEIMNIGIDSSSFPSRGYAMQRVGTVANMAKQIGELEIVDIGIDSRGCSSRGHTMQRVGTVVCKMV